MIGDNSIILILQQGVCIGGNDVHGENPNDSLNYYGSNGFIKFYTVSQFRCCNSIHIEIFLTLSESVYTVQYINHI